MKNNLIYIVCFMIVLFSCKKGGPSDIIPPETPIPIIPPPANTYSNYNIFATGAGLGAQGSIDLTWKNFQTSYTSGSIDPTNWGHLGRDLVISGTDIYQAATKKFRNTGVGVEEDFGGCVLKNGSILYSDAGQATAIRGLAVNGSDVYYLSSHYQNALLAVSRPKLWKNGVVLYNLTTPYAGGQQQAFDVNVAGSDVFVGGYDYKTNSTESSCGYWKNGVYNEFFKNTDGFTIYPLRRMKFYISENLDKYYMATFVNANVYQSRIYKNGVRIPGIDINSSNSTFLDFAFNGNDLYVIGINGSEPSIWKNGIRSKLPFESIGDTATSICIVDGKIFLGGTTNSNNYGLVWEYLSATNSLVKIGHPESSTGISKIIVLKK